MVPLHQVSFYKPTPRRYGRFVVYIFIGLARSIDWLKPTNGTIKTSGQYRSGPFGGMVLMANTPVLHAGIPVSTTGSSRGSIHNFIVGSQVFGSCKNRLLRRARWMVHLVWDQECNWVRFPGLRRQDNHHTPPI